MKATLVVDCSTGTILAVHCSPNQPHDTQVGRQLIARNLHRLSILTADKGYDATDLPEMLRAHGVRPVIKHRAFTPLNGAHNAWLDDSVSPQRSAGETAVRVLNIDDRGASHGFGRSIIDSLFLVPSTDRRVIGSSVSLLHDRVPPSSSSLVRAPLEPLTPY